MTRLETTLCLMPYVLSPKDLVSRPDKIAETVLHTHFEVGRWDLSRLVKTMLVIVSFDEHRVRRSKTYPLRNFAHRNFTFEWASCPITISRRLLF